MAGLANQKIFQNLELKQTHFHQKLIQTQKILSTQDKAKQITTIPCKWQPPPEHYSTLNIDGSIISETQQAGAGCIVRNHHGNFIRACATYLGRTYNITVEFQALLICLKLCMPLNISKLVIQTDSQVMNYDPLLNYSKTAATPLLQILLDDALHLMTQIGEVHVNFSYCEPNQVADRLAMEASRRCFGNAVFCNDVLHFVWYFCLDWQCNILAQDSSTFLRSVIKLF